MHEYALMEEVLEQAEGHLKSEGAQAVRQIVLRVGDVSGYSVESLRQAYEALRGSTTFPEAELVIHGSAGDSIILESIVLEG